MLLRNIDPTRGLCNDTRLVVIRIGSYMFQARLANKPGGSLELIPRFTLSTQEGELPFTLTREQFPIKLCFAMTINKSQGQSLKHVGIDLRQYHLCMDSYISHCQESPFWHLGPSARKFKYNQQRSPPRTAYLRISILTTIATLTTEL